MSYAVAVIIAGLNVWLLIDLERNLQLDTGTADLTLKLKTVATVKEQVLVSADVSDSTTISPDIRKAKWCANR